MFEIINLIVAKNQKEGIVLHPPASADEIDNFEKTIGFPMPDDFREFYAVCNGFECNQDIFNFISLQDIIENGDYGDDWFHFSEYMIYADMWTLKKGDTAYSVVNTDHKYGPEIVLTTSLITFLEHFLAGNVFGDEGLHKWRESLQ